MKKTRHERREVRHNRVRAKVSGTMERPRLSIYKSNTRIVAQVIDDVSKKTIAAVDSTSEKGKTPRERAELAGHSICMSVLCDFPPRVRGGARI